MRHDAYHRERTFYRTLDPSESWLPVDEATSARVLVVGRQAATAAWFEDEIGRTGEYEVQRVTWDAGTVRWLCHHVRHEPLEALVLEASDRPGETTELLGALRAANWSLPILLVAAPDAVPDTEVLGGLGIPDVLEVPTDGHKLRRAVRRLVWPPDA